MIEQYSNTNDLRQKVGLLQITEIFNPKYSSEERSKILQEYKKKFDQYFQENNKHESFENIPLLYPYVPIPTFKKKSLILEERNQIFKEIIQKRRKITNK